MNSRQKVMLEQTIVFFLQRTGLNEDSYAACSDRWETRHNTVSEKKNLLFVKVTQLEGRV